MQQLKKILILFGCMLLGSLFICSVSKAATVADLYTNAAKGSSWYFSDTVANLVGTTVTKEMADPVNRHVGVYCMQNSETSETRRQLYR